MVKKKNEQSEVEMQLDLLWKEVDKEKNSFPEKKNPITIYRDWNVRIVLSDGLGGKSDVLDLEDFGGNNIRFLKEDDKRSMKEIIKIIGEFSK